MKHTRNIVRVVFLLIALLLVSPAVRAQLDDAGLRFGFKAGFGSADLSLTKFCKLGESRTTFTLGGFAEYRLSTWLSATVGLEYTQNGGSNVPPRLLYSDGSQLLYQEYPDEGYVSMIRTNLRIHTLEVPVTGRVSLPEAGNFKPFFMAGPSFGFNLGATTTFYREHVIEPDAANHMVVVSSNKVKDKISPVNVSALFGVGSEFSAYDKIFELGVTYRLGLVNQNNLFESQYQQYTSNSFMGYIAFKF